MAIYLTADTHGAKYVGKLEDFNAGGLTRDDYVIVLGDFCFPWESPESPEDERWLDESKDVPSTHPTRDESVGPFLRHKRSIQPFRGRILLRASNKAARPYGPKTGVAKTGRPTHFHERG